MSDFNLISRSKFKLLWRGFVKKRVNSCKNEWFQLSYECWNLSCYGETLQKWRQIHAKMSDFDLNLGRFLSYIGEGFRKIQPSWQIKDNAHD